MPDTRLTGPGSPLVYSTYDDDARIALRVAERHGLRTIRRTVIDDNSLEIPVRLPSDRIEAGIEIVFQIVNRNNDPIPRALIFPFPPSMQSNLPLSRSGCRLRRKNPCFSIIFLYRARRRRKLVRQRNPVVSMTTTGRMAR